MQRYSSWLRRCYLTKLSKIFWNLKGTRILSLISQTSSSRRLNPLRSSSMTWFFQHILCSRFLQMCSEINQEQEFLLMELTNSSTRSSKRWNLKLVKTGQSSRSLRRERWRQNSGSKSVFHSTTTLLLSQTGSHQNDRLKESPCWWWFDICMRTLSSTTILRLNAGLFLQVKVVILLQLDMLCVA